MERNEETEYAIDAQSGDLVFRNGSGAWLLAPQDWENEFDAAQWAALERVDAERNAE